MNRKKGNVIISIAILLIFLGFVCIAIAASIEDTVEYAHIIGLSAFGFWGLSVFLLLKNISKIISLEINEYAEQMYNDANFFSKISLIENPETLKKRFIRSGFKKQQGYLHKIQFSFAKDYINYYVAIVKDENIIEYFNEAVNEMDELVQTKLHFKKNNVVYLFFFNSNITPEELNFLQNVIINQEIAQGLSLIYNTVLPIIYDTVNQKYIIKITKSRFSINILHIALRKFYKMIGLAE